MYVPSISATGEPFAGSKSAIAAWCDGRSTLCGKTETSLQPSPADGQIARHRAEQAVVAGEGRDPRRHRGGARRELGVGARERVEELVEIEQLLHLRAGQHEHPP